jgi:hypothetical protein
MPRPDNVQFDLWKDAVEAADTFRFNKVGGDKALLMRAWTALRDYGEDPLGAEMLILRDVAEGINSLVEKARKFDALETILNDTSAPGRRVIERLSDVFYD